MSETRNKSLLILGILLVLAGVIVLLNKLGLEVLNWKKIFSVLLVIYGATLGYSGFGLNSNRKVFWGSAFFFFGLYLFLNSFNLLNPEIHFFWPTLLIVFGLSFLMTFVNRPNDFVLLLPSIALTGLGVLFLLTNLGVIYSFEVWDQIGKFWPIGLIILGLYLIFKKGERKT